MLASVFVKMFVSLCVFVKVFACCSCLVKSERETVITVQRCHNMCVVRGGDVMQEGSCGFIV